MKDAQHLTGIAYGLSFMPLNSRRLLAAIKDAEQWAASARKYIADYKSGRLTED